MEFPSLDWMKAFQQKCNVDEKFRTATKWADTKMVFDFEGQRYWLKLYKGSIIDLMEYSPTFSPLGYDITIRGSMDAWKSVRDRKRVFWDPLNNYEIEIDGNLLESHRLHEAIVIMCQEILPEVQ